ncbi:hypothetical protein RCC89_13850 [Cytophagaceae bacterium ABcell3]|nr:hypothetical protein RCC89_13850 [Cytophagaceae bacterium ABcell3]
MSFALLTACDEPDGFVRDPEVEEEMEIESEEENKPVMVKDTIKRTDTLNNTSDTLDTSSHSEAAEPDTVKTTKPVKKKKKPTKYYLLRHKVFITDADSEKNNNKRGIFYGSFNLVPKEMTWEHYHKNKKKRKKP